MIGLDTIAVFVASVIVAYNADGDVAKIVSISAVVAVALVVRVASNG